MSEVYANGFRAELPKGWEWQPVAALAADEPRAITDGPFGSNLKSAHYTVSGPRVIRLQNIGNGVFLDSEVHISDVHFESLRAHEAMAGDVVVASLGDELPRACVVPAWLGPAIVKADCPRIRARSEVNPHFLALALNSRIVRQQAARIIHGVGRQRLRLADLKKLLIPTPPTEEQEHVVGAVQALASVCAEGDTALDAASTALRRYRRSLLHRAFDGPLTTPLAEIAEIRSGLTKGRKTREPTMEIPFLRAANVREGSLDLAEIKTIPATDSERERFKLEPGDVLMVEGSGSPGRLGQGWIWEGQPELCLHQNHVFCARPDTERCLARYLAWFIQSPNARDYFRTMAKTTSGLTTMNKREMSALPIPLPALEEQQSLVGQLDSMSFELTGIGAAIGAGAMSSRALHSAVLNAALAGRLAERGFTGEAQARQTSGVT